MSIKQFPLITCSNAQKKGGGAENLQTFFYEIIKKENWNIN